MHSQLKYWLSERRARESGQRGKLNNREPRHGHRSHLSAAVGSTDQGSRRIGQERPIQQELDIQSLDPHMARLLSGLTLSAQPGTGAHDGSSQGSVVGSTPSRPTSTDESLSSVAPSPYMVPTSTSARSNESGVTARDVNHAQLVASAPTRGEVPNAIITNVSALPSSSPMTTPRSATLSSTWTSTSTSSGPTSMTSSGILPSPHGSTSTAERSPYLSQPPEPLSSDKRMKHLALLETVVDESARQAAISRAGTAMGMAGNHSTQHHVGNSPSTALPPVDLVAALSQAKHPQPAPVVVSHHDLPPSAHHPYSSNVPSYRPQLNPPLIRPQPVTASHSSNLSLQGWPRGSAPDPQLLSLLTSGPAPPAQYPAFYPPRSQALSTAPREHGFINNGPVWPQMSDGIMQGVMQNGYHRSYPGSAAPFPSSMPGPSATPFIRPPVLPKTTNIASTANLLSILNTTAPTHPAHHTTVRPPPYAS
jgi:mRNA-decapping enzyme subunit 2